MKDAGDGRVFPSERAASRGTPSLSCNSLSVEYGSVPAFCDVTLEVSEGESLAIVGPSGSGKTSLLLCLAGVVAPSAGDVRVDDVSVWTLSARQRTRLRRSRIGYVEQSAGLVPELTLAENVALPLRLQGRRPGDALKEAKQALDVFGIGALAARFPDEVSGGELQRAAIARALVHRPAIVLADEPTGALDASNKELVLAELLSAAKEAGAGVVIVTHDVTVASAADCQLDMARGMLGSPT